MARSSFIVGRTGDLVISDETVSEHHARVELQDGRWRLTDLGSRNGVWQVHGERFEKHADGAVSLDQPISFGRHRTTLRLLLKNAGVFDEPPEQPPSRAAEVRPRRCGGCGSVVPSTSQKCPSCGAPS